LRNDEGLRVRPDVRCRRHAHDLLDGDRQARHRGQGDAQPFQLTRPQRRLDHPDLEEPRCDATQLPATLREGDPEVIEAGDERRLAAALAESPMAMPAWLFYSILGLSVVIILALIVRLVGSKG
jgi:hypothetical protein